MRYTQPQQFAPLDPAYGSTFAYNAAILGDVVSAACVLNGSPAKAIVPDGVALRFDTSAKYLAVTRKAASTLGPFNFLYVFSQLGSVVNGGTVLAMPGSSGNNNKIDIYTLSTGAIRADVYNSAGSVTSVDSATGALVAGGRYALSLIFNGTTLQWMVNGGLSGSAVTFSGSRTAESMSFTIGGTASAAASANHDIKLAAFVGDRSSPLTSNPWQLFRSQQRVMLAAAGGTNTPINPGVGALALAGYAPSVTQSANLSLTPGAGSIGITGYAPSISQPQAITAGVGALTLTGYAPTVTQGITTSIVPGAGALNLTGYAPSIAQSANQSVMPDAGSLSISGYVPAIAQTTNQSVAPAPGSLTLTGYAPTVAQALASPNLVPQVGALSITGYAPTVEQSTPITKIGGDDAPGHDEADERVEVWEKRAPTPRRDDSLDKVIREAYAKAIGKPAAPVVAKAEPKPVAPAEPAFDSEEDDLEVLLLSF